MASGNIFAGHTVFVAFGNALRPAPEPGTIPFEAVTRMAETVGWYAKERIVLGVWRRDHHRLWPHLHKKCALEHCQPVRRNMFDTFDQHRAVKAAKIGTTFGHGAVNEIDLDGTFIPQFCEPATEALERSAAQIDADDAFDLRLAHQLQQKVTIATAKICHRSGAALKDGVFCRFESLRMKNTCHGGCTTFDRRTITPTACPRRWRAPDRHTPLLACDCAPGAKLKFTQ